MSDVPPESGPPPSDPDPTRVLPPDRAPEAPAKQRFVDRMWSFRALIAVALAAVILGGLGGAALASAGDHQDNRGPGRFQHGGPMGPGGQQWQWGDGPRGDQMPRGMGPRQWSQQGPNGLHGGRRGGVPSAPVVPSQPSPSPKG